MKLTHARDYCSLTSGHVTHVCILSPVSRRVLGTLFPGFVGVVMEFVVTASLGFLKARDRGKVERKAKGTYKESIISI